MNLDEKSEREAGAESYNSYIGAGPAHLPAPNAQFQVVKIEEEIGQKKSRPSVDTSSQDSAKSAQELESVDIFVSDSPIDLPESNEIKQVELEVPILESEKHVPINVKKISLHDENIEEEADSSVSNSGEDQDSSDSDAQVLAETRNEIDHLSIDECDVKNEEEEEAEKSSENSRKRTRTLDRSSPGSEPSTSLKKLDNSEDFDVRMEEDDDDSDRFIEKFNDQSVESQALLIAEQNRPPVVNVETIPYVDAEKIAQNEALDEMLATVAETESCFDPDFDHIQTCRAYDTDTNSLTYVYTDVPGYSGENVEKKDPDNYFKQPWFPNESDEDDEEHLELENILKRYLSDKKSGIIAFYNLIHTLRGIEFDETEDLLALEDYFFEEHEAGRKEETLEIFRFIVELASTAPQVLPKKLFRLRGVHIKSSVTLSQHQCAVLVANMFLSVTKNRSFYRIMQGKEDKELMVEKLRFMMNYFKTIREKMPDGIVSFRRRTRLRVRNEIKNDRTNISLLNFIVSENLVIEQAHGCTQMDFANRFIGGGVLGRGAVQEEIRFLMCPELFVTMLICQRMNDLDAIFVVGAQTYSSYSGYGNSSLRFVPLTPEDAKSNEIRDKFKRIRNEIVALDAIDFSGPYSYQQYNTNAILRELSKLVAGFDTNTKVKLPVVTGLWGCGAFKGDAQFKAMLQVMAATMTERPMIFCTFGDEQLATKLRNIVYTLQKKNITVGKLYQLLTQYYNRGYLSKTSVVDYLSIEIDDDE